MVSIKWFPKIWFLNQKMVSQNMVLNQKMVSISWFSIILWYSSRGFHLVVLNHHMVSIKCFSIIIWFHYIVSQSSYGFIKVSQSSYGYNKIFSI